jgi:hypothetical protein
MNNEMQLTSKASMLDSCEVGYKIKSLQSPSFYSACNFHYATDYHYDYLFLSWEELIT